MTTSDRLIRNLLHASVMYLARGTAPRGEGRPDILVEEVLVSTYAGAAAFLLDALSPHLSAEAIEAIAEELTDLMEDGEPLAEWVADAATARGIDVDEIVSRHTESGEGATQ